jgi:hypothetical protein
MFDVALSERIGKFARRTVRLQRLGFEHLTDLIC